MKSKTLKKTKQEKTCPKCASEMKTVKVKIQDASRPVTSYQCSKCGYFDFEDKSIKKAIAEIKAKEEALQIKQKIIKLSHDRLGMYINRDIARSLNLTGGEEVFVSVPDKKHMVVSINH
ncbi:hypothetical protein KY348_02785 [Candidatus Woesearchaeota archaeon]|nr:hypothetical protein [Candidatus Woesearchaeota archaeon]